MSSKVSVVIPVYNSESTIKVVVEAVLNQTLQVDEIIIINDGSTDNTDCVISGIINDNKSKVKIRYYSKDNGGAASARNFGINKAKNTYIATCDSDDVWANDKIENEMKIFTEYPDATLVGSNLNGKVYKRFYWIRFKEVMRISSNMQMFKNFFSPSSVIFNKSKLVTILPELFPATQRYAEEGIVFLMLTKKGNCFLLNKSYVDAGFNKPLYGHSGLSGNLKEMQKGELSNFKYFLNQKGVSVFVYCIAVIYSNIKYIRRIIVTKTRKGSWFG